MKSVAIVMASYNGEKYIKQQIESIMNQIYPKFSLLVRDDGSSDHTKEILEAYSQQDKLTWYSGKHLNVASGFIDLLRNAPNADYYAFADQDDVWLEDKIAAAVNLLEKEDDNLPLFYYSATTLVDQKLNFIMEHGIHSSRTDKARFLINDMSGNTVLINKKLKDLICKADCHDISIHDKWALQVCLANGGKCIADPVSHILYRQHLGNTIGMELSVWDKIRKFIRIINDKPDVNLRILARNYHVVEPYAELVELTRKEKVSVRDRLKIALDKEIDFDNLFFNIAFKIRILKGIL